MALSPIGQRVTQQNPSYTGGVLSMPQKAPQSNLSPIGQKVDMSFMSRIPDAGQSVRPLPGATISQGAGQSYLPKFLQTGLDTTKEALFGNVKDKTYLRDLQNRGKDPGFLTNLRTEGILPFLGRDKTEQVERLSQSHENKGTDSSRAADLAFYKVNSRGIAPTNKAREAKDRYEALNPTRSEKVTAGLQGAGQKLGSVLDATFVPIGRIKPVGKLLQEFISEGTARIVQKLGKNRVQIKEGHVWKTVANEQEAIKQLTKKPVLSKPVQKTVDEWVAKNAPVETTVAKTARVVEKEVTPTKIQPSRRVNELIESYASGEKEVNKINVLTEKELTPKERAVFDKKVAEIERGNKYAIEQLSKELGISEYGTIEALGNYIDIGERRGGRTVTDFYKYLDEIKANEIPVKVTPPKPILAKQATEKATTKLETKTEKLATEDRQVAQRNLDKMKAEADKLSLTQLKGIDEGRFWGETVTAQKGLKAAQDTLKKLRTAKKNATGLGAGRSFALDIIKAKDNVNQYKRLLESIQESAKSRLEELGGLKPKTKFGPKPTPVKTEPVLAKAKKAPKVPRIKIDAELKEIRTAIKNKEMNATNIDELSMRIDFAEEGLPNVGKLKQIAGRNTDDTLQQIQANASKKIETNILAKDMSITDAVRILKKPKAHNAKTVEAARLVRRANLDDVATQEGFASLDEAQQAIETHARMTDDIAELRETLKLQKGERALANKASKVASTVSASRRSYIRELQDQFQLTDGDVKKLTFGRDLQRMGESEFQGFIRRMETRAVQVQNTKQAKWELSALLEDKHFTKVDNYRKVQKLPTINNMNETQLRQYAKSLEGFNVGDEFLSPRTLETISRTELGKVSTMREVRTHLWDELKKNPEFKDVKLEDLENMTSNVVDNMRYDTALAEKNPFYNLVVKRTQTEMMRGKASFLKIQEETNRLTKLANSSRKKGVVGTLKQALVPKQKEIVTYLEAEPSAKKVAMEALTKEELDLAVHMEQYYRGALDHLIAIEELRGSRYADAYFTHTKKQFLEKWSDDSLIGAIRGVFQAQRDEAQIAKIIDQDTGQILAKNKFFKYTLRRTGTGEASNNATKVFLDYAMQMERKKMLDRVIPEIEVYTQALSPKGMTKKGMELDRSLKTFINKYLNNKKGRRENFGGLLAQGGKLDVALRIGNTFVSLKDLAGNIFAGTATFVGEFVMTYQALGKKGMATGLKRRLWDTGIVRGMNPNAVKILKEAEPFLGRNVWTEIMEPNVSLGDKALIGIFSPFSQSSVETNKLFLLGKLTKEEVAVGKLSPERLAELRLEAGRWRDMGSEVKSIYGATSGGATVNKYKGWAIPIARTNIKNLTLLSNRIKSGNFKGTLTSREFQETYRAIEMSAAIYYVGSKAMEDVDQDTFIGKLYARIQMEALTIMGGIDPTVFASTPRLASFIIRLTENLKTLVTLEKYKTTGKGYEEGELKGVNYLQKQFTPSVVKQFTSVEQKTPEQKLKAKKANERAEERAKVQPIYDNVQSLISDGNEAEAQKIVDGLSDADYETYKKIRTSERAKNTEQFRLKLELDPKQAVEYLHGLSKPEAERVLNLMTDEEYARYETGKP